MAAGVVTQILGYSYSSHRLDVPEIPPQGLTCLCAMSLVASCV